MRYDVTMLCCVKWNSVSEAFSLHCSYRWIVVCVALVQICNGSRTWIMVIYIYLYIIHIIYIYIIGCSKKQWMHYKIENLVPINSRQFKRINLARKKLFVNLSQKSTFSNKRLCFLLKFLHKPRFLLLHSFW